MSNDFDISTCRTYKVRIKADETLQALNSHVNSMAAKVVTTIMLAEQVTDRTWNIAGVDHPNYDAASEFKKQFPKADPKDAKAFFDWFKYKITKHKVPKLDKDTGKQVIDKNGKPVTKNEIYSANNFRGMFKGKGKEKVLKEIFPVYQRLMTAGFFPFVTAYVMADSKKKNSQVNDAVNYAVVTRLSSFFMCDEKTKAQYKDINDEFTNIVAKLNKNDATNLVDLIEYAKKTFCTNDENVGRFLSQKFIEFLREVYLKDTTIDTTLDRYSYRKKDGTKRFLRFSINQDIMNFIKSRHGLAQTIVENHEAIKLYDMKCRFNATSRISIPDEVHSPVDIHCGSNFIKYKIEEKDGEFYFGDIGNKLFKIPYLMRYKKESGLYQMMNLSIKPIEVAVIEAAEDEDDEEEKKNSRDTSYKISFDINGKRRREGELNECSIQHRNGVWLLNLTFASEEFDSKLAKIYSSGLDKAKSKKNQDDIKDIIAKDGCMRCLGVDLGMNPNFGWSVVESIDSFGKNTHIAKSGIEGLTDYKSYFMQLFFDLRNSCTTLRQLLNLTNDVISHKQTLVQYDLDMIDQILEKSDVVNKDDIIAMLSDTSKSLSDQKFKRTWCLKKLRKHIVSIFGKMKDYRRCHNQTASPNEAIYMIDAINMYIAILTKYNKIGYFNPDKTAHEAFKELRDYRNNLHDDTLKKLAFSVVNVALENKCHFIAVENLKMMLHNQKGGLANIFAYGEFKNKIQQIAATRGMPVVEVDPTATSQIHPVTGEWGYRHIDAYDGDFIAATGERLESDGYVAASNIAKRALCFHTDLKILKIKGDGTHWMIASSFGVRILGMLGISLTDSFHVVDGRLIKNSLVVQPTDTSIETSLYLHEGKWLDKDQHKAIVESISERVSAGEKLVVARKAAGA